jgi:Phospholipase A2-like domain
VFHLDRAGVHNLYPEIIGVAVKQLIVDQGPSANATPAPKRPLGKESNDPIPGYNYCGPGNNGGSTSPATTDDCCKAHDSCYDQYGLSGNNVVPGHAGYAVGPAQRNCDQALCGCIRMGPVPAGAYDRFVRWLIQGQFCYGGQ